MESVLSCINQGPRVEHDGKREDPIRFTFDDFLHPVIEAWRAKKPYIPLIYDLPAPESKRISTTYHLPHLFLGLNPFTQGYSDHEVDIFERTSEDEDE